MMNFFDNRRRSGLDRRTGEERRERVVLDHFAEEPAERRKFTERRTKGEMRDGWVRVSRWSSVPVPTDIHLEEPDPCGDPVYAL